MERIEVAEKLITIFVTVVGAGVAWVKFVGGRYDKVRLEPVLACQVLDELPDGTAHILATATLSNKGLFSAPVPKSGFFVEIFTAQPGPPPGDDIHVTRWHPRAAFPLFLKHSSVQVGEVVQDQVRFAIDANKHSTVKVRLRVKYDNRKILGIPLTYGTTWEAVSTVLCKSPLNQAP